ncbi:MAG: polysaccharide pyruvyl transferase family protein [Rhodococcus sp.]|nr:polysaccharide pyruvyl transferase family protein [Rhodococcus sp. (in: high G+C Gram-positive bacteria)]
MVTIGMLDTSLDSTNDGDEIIVDAVLNNFPLLEKVQRFPTHRRLRKEELAQAEKCEVLVLTGTNILRSKIRRDRQWPMGIAEYRAFRGRVVMVGVGWRRYEHNPNSFNRHIIENLLNPDIAVSARDEYTNRKLGQIGVTSENTGCPTMWNLPDKLPPLGNSEECVFTLTDYNPAKETDEAILRDLSQRYRSIKIWPQSSKDLRDINRMRLPANATVADRGTRSLNSIVRGRDYVGTRLHAGIRAAQLGSAVLVVAVDNRGLEIGRDTGLPVVERNLGLANFQGAYRSATESPSAIVVPRHAVQRWRSELNDLLSSKSA